MIQLPSLYEHQTKMVSSLRKTVGEGCNAVILQAPPGTGKTRTAKFVMGSSANKQKGQFQSGFSVFAVHRRSLVDNASDSFNEDPKLPHGVIMSQVKTDWTKETQVASIDTLLAWYVKNGEYQGEVTFDLIVFDECHSHHTKLASFLKAHDAKRLELELLPVVVIGLSATPEAKGLSDVFKSIVLGPKTDWLIDQNYLSPFKYFQATLGDLSKVDSRYSVDSVSEAMKGLAGDLVKDWKRLGQGRPTVGFFPRIDQSEEARDMLRAAGIRAEHVDGKTPDDERQSLFRKLGNGTIDYLCNVGVVERGTNIPEVSCVQLCTMIGSKVRFNQMVGRGSRTAEGKDHCIVIDHGGNIANHGFFEDHVEWLLDYTKNVDKTHEGKPTIICPSCGRAYRGGLCSCGYEPTTGERASQGLLFLGGELKEVQRKEKSPKKNRSCEEIMISALYMAGKSNRTWKQAMGIAYGIAKKQGTRFRIPKQFTVGGREYRPVPYGHADGGRRVRHLYDFTDR